MYQATRCPCGHRACKDWHVEPVAAFQGVKFTEAQARVVADLLNAMELTAPEPETKPIVTCLRTEIASWAKRFDTRFLAPNAIVPVRADLLTLALSEIDQSNTKRRALEVELAQCKADLSVSNATINYHQGSIKP